MKCLFNIFCLSLLLTGLSFNALTQTATGQLTVNNQKIVKWKMLSGTGGEMFFAVPENATLHSGGDYYLGNNGLARVDSLKTLIANLNNTILQVDLYEGQSLEIQKRLIKTIKANQYQAKTGQNGEVQDAPPSDANSIFEIKEKSVNGFFWTSMQHKSPELFSHIQFFRVRTRLYVLKVFTRNQNDPVIRDFFETVKLISKEQVVSPNLGEKSESPVGAKMILPAAVKINSEAASETVRTYEDKEIDRKPVVVFIPVLPTGEIDSRFYKTFNTIKLKVQLLANGKIGSVETITKVSRAIEKEALEIAREIKFLPAEKNGAPVSTYITIEHGISFR